MTKRWNLFKSPGADCAKGIADAVYLEREGDILWDLEKFEEARVKWSEAVEAGGGKKRLNEKLNREVE